MLNLRRELRAVTFDCWNTLIRQRDVGVARGIRERALAEILTERGRPVSADQARGFIDVAFARHRELWESGVASGSAHMARWALLEAGVDDAEVAERVAQVFTRAGLEEPVAPIEGARETLDRLAGSGVRIGLICDTGFSPGPVVRQLLERAGLLGRLEVQVFSDELGVPKPDPRAFWTALEGLGVAPEHSAHVGDLRRTDVAGARGVGMTSIRLRDAYDDRSEHPEADAVVDSYAQLADLLPSS